MSEHYHTANISARPKILGLTASPIFNAKQPVTALKEIEKLTDCTVYVVKQNISQLLQFSFQAEDRIVDYRPTPTVFPLYEAPSLWAELHTRKLLPNDLLFPTKRPWGAEVVSPESQWYRTLSTRYHSTISALGPFAADVFVLVHIATAVEGIKSELAMVLPTIKDPDEDRRQSLNDIAVILSSHQARLATEGPILPNGWLSPKLVVLKELLLEQDWQGFRGIIFTHERQVATTLALILPRLGVAGVVAGPLVGHGQNICSEPTKVGMKGMSFRAQEHILDDFRSGKLNMLIATSVAEEGLDFPQCSFVCRFDPPRTLPQYIQSRGRARLAGSSFVIMLEEGPSIDRGRVEALQLGEIRVKRMYGKNMDRAENETLDADSGQEEDPAFEGRFIVEKTGASITPAGAISLLNNVCSIIPRDPHTPPLQPRYKIHPLLHTCELRLPAALPIPRESLVVNGTPFTRTKKAAKRSAAFNAVVHLYELGVFDEYLLPLRRDKGDTAEDVDGKPPIDVTSIEPMMDVFVCDPWGNVWEEGASMYLHTLNAAGRRGMGLICASRMSHFQGEMMASRQKISLDVSSGVMIKMDGGEKRKALDLMDKYMKHGIRYGVTGKGLQKPLSVYLVPIDNSGLPDWNEMEHAIHTPASQDWGGIDTSNSDNLLVSLVHHNKVCKFFGFRQDLNVTDCVSTNTSLAKLIAYRAKFGEDLPEDDLVLQCRQVLQTTATEFRDASRQKAGLLAKEDMYLPQSLCQWVNFPQELLDWFLLLPPLLNFLTSIFRARAVQEAMEAPTLDLDRTIEAFTLPSANSSFNNQRLETLGDAFLKLATSVHVFMKHPHKHEGQLSVLRQNSVCNRYLLGRGHVQNLESFMNNEKPSQRTWRMTTVGSVKVGEDWFVKRVIPRRSVQDCMEALLGAAWLSGGVRGALEVGTRLDLCFGGTKVWWERGYQTSSASSVGSPFPELEEALGYEFHDKSLLIEALTHPSFTGAGASYQRLEFLGDGELSLF
jgi:endoribonuclease Dicer